MKAFITALLLGLGGGTWIYTKLQQRTGYGNSKTAFKGAAIAGVIIFIVVLTITLTVL